MRSAIVYFVTSVGICSMVNYILVPYATSCEGYNVSDPWVSQPWFLLVQLLFIFSIEFHTTLMVFKTQCVESILPEKFQFHYLSGNPALLNLEFWPYSEYKNEQFVSATPYNCFTPFIGIKDTMCRFAY